MTYLLTDDDITKLLFAGFQDDYPGYRPTVIESPHGDGKWDIEKRYFHIAMKYLEKDPHRWRREMFDRALKDATTSARTLAMRLGVPLAFWPTYTYSAIRVLEYPPGARSHRHTDFDLFTLMLYRNIQGRFRYVEPEHPSYLKQKAREWSHSIHFGELMPMLLGKDASADMHYVEPFERTQFSAVFFGIPDHGAVLPTGATVGEWIEERMARSRREVE